MVVAEADSMVAVVVTAVADTDSLPELIKTSD
jgi:hypothetical protein